ncbi:MAG: BamA/TamA family outer membrane protein [Chitinophagaceae bacterium]
MALMIYDGSIFLRKQMAKVTKHFCTLFILAFLGLVSTAQTGYPVQYVVVDSLFADAKPVLQSRFSSLIAASDYLAQLTKSLKEKGYVTASVDYVKLDSLSGRVTLFIGKQYKWAKINTQAKDLDVLQALRWNEVTFLNSTLDFERIKLWLDRILNYLEDNGHPFAKTFLDSMEIRDGQVAALMRIDRGPLYRIDSIRVYGDAKIDNEFLQRFLDITNNSLYSKKKLKGVSAKLAALTYVQEERPFNLTLLGTGSVLNLYLKAKKSSQVNGLVGFLPNNDATAKRKLLVTGELNVLLRNALGAGETIGLNWQQLQQQSPRLNLLYEHPFVFRSPFGTKFTFDMYRKDTTYLNIKMRLGGVYVVGSSQSATVFIQRLQSIVNGVNAVQVQQSKRLPAEGDVSSNNLGFTYDFNNTDYRFNPRKGAELSVTTSAGSKKIKKNNIILELKDPFNPNFKYASLYDTIKLKTYQLRISGSAAKYFPVGRQGALKTGINAGLYQSGSIFRNELFQIGGYRLLRGFDEESQYLSQYAIGTIEYRYLIGQNSAFFAFGDGGWGKAGELRINHQYISAGLGLSFETKAGIFNIVWALGKREDRDLNLRQSKIHLGYINYF